MLKKVLWLKLALMILIGSSCADVAGRGEHNYSGSIILEKGDVSQDTDEEQKAQKSNVEKE